MQITGGYLNSRKIDSPKGNNVRPTLSQIRESIFSILFGLIDFEESTFLDAFAGSGIMGFEALSRGFKRVSFIEKDKKTFALLKTNSEKLNVKPDFHFGDTSKTLKKLESEFDVIYIDPPYQGGLYNEVLDIIKTHKLLKTQGILVLEHPKSLDINITDFKLVKQKTYSDKSLTFLGLSN
ncbi:MAG: 16S rRNA (guanine(966)-N(2))-methyltransferase RsmD [Clostridium sp.]|nr:16S rRNA (guanine(966)-N(2))-methyltransferase RsmD [Clostridium sp.]